MTSMPVPGILLSGGPDGPFNPLEVGDGSLLFWQLIIFALLFFLLLWKVWGPLMRTVNERERRIQGDIDSAEAARREAEAARERLRVELDQASDSARRLLAEAEERAAKLRQEMEEEARVQAQAMIRKAQGQIEAEKAQAVREIRDQVVELSVEITRRLLRRDVGREDHLREAEALIARMRS
jgi:F-type H+-transporting ATPase subunit b